MSEHGHWNGGLLVRCTDRRCLDESRIEWHVFGVFDEEKEWELIATVSFETLNYQIIDYVTALLCIREAFGFTVSQFQVSSYGVITFGR